MRLAYFGVGSTPVRAKKAEAALAGGNVDAAVAALDLDPPDDLQASAAVKKHLAGVLLRRVAAQLMEARCMSDKALDLALDISLTVNGERVHERVEARKTLVDFLREDLALTGSHVGCEHGVCGACTVRVNGEIVRGCLMLAVQCDGATVETIEGLSDSGEIADLQAAFEQRNALQCGYLHPRHDRGGAGPAETREGQQIGAEPRRHPRASLRQLLPLHRLPRHRRRGGSGGASQGGRQQMTQPVRPRASGDPGLQGVNSLARSCQAGLAHSINSGFQTRFHFLNCRSRRIAACVPRSPLARGRTDYSVAS